MGEPHSPRGATGTSPDGAVTLAVDAHGVLQSLQFSPAVSTMNLDVLAATILATSRDARARAARTASAGQQPSPSAAHLAEDDLDEGFTRGG